jgi:hypothetical protein
MTTLKMTSTLLFATALTAFMGVEIAVAGKTVMEKDYVGKVENLDRGHSGKEDLEPIDPSRFAGSGNTIAEGPPHGDSKPDCVPTGFGV